MTTTNPETEALWAARKAAKEQRNARFKQLAERIKELDAAQLLEARRVIDRNIATSKELCKADGNDHLQLYLTRKQASMLYDLIEANLPDLESNVADLLPPVESTAPAVEEVDWKGIVVAILTKKGGYMSKKDIFEQLVQRGYEGSYQSAVKFI